MNPSIDPQLTPAERAVFAEIYPQLDKINKRIGERIEFLLLVNLARRLVSMGKAPEEIVDAVRHHVEHQATHNRSKAN